MRWKDEPVALVMRPLAALAAARPSLRVTAGEAMVIVGAAARDAAWRHVAASSLERGGLLVGEPFARDEDAAAVAAVVVRLAVPSDDDTADAVSLRMQARVWEHARAALRPGERVVGWFHSHPGIGAFFSGTDRRTHAAFFSQPFALGWVIDPVGGEEAWFVGADARDVVKSRVCVSDSLP